MSSTVEVTHRMGPRVAVRILPYKCPMLQDTMNPELISWCLEQIAVALYINPLGDLAAWDWLIGYPKEKMPILIANVMNGLDLTVDASWTDVITRGAALGKMVLANAVVSLFGSVGKAGSIPG